MNTIPITLDAGAVPYTVVGGPAAGSGGPAARVSVVLLNRGSRFARGDALRELSRAGFESILSVEPRGDSLDAESLSPRSGGLRFLLLSEPASVGVQVNLAMRESPGPYVFVLWSDMALSAQALSSRFFDRLAERDILCRAPLFFGKGGEALPSAAAPALHKSSLKVLRLVPSKDGARSLYPFDYAGIYSKEKFVLTGGFDPLLTNQYWQKLDFGFRAWLWGEEIRVSQALKVAYSGAPPVEDETADDCYKWFWLKNLAPSFRGDSALIPSSRLWSYLRRRPGGPAKALAEFREAREWVRTSRYRFRSDAPSLVDLWEEE
jgi:hypothetical protein